jgi:hypothetical protein
MYPAARGHGGKAGHCARQSADNAGLLLSHLVELARRILTEDRTT